MLSQFILVTLLTSSFKLTQAQHCSTHGSVRLVGGSGTYEGRVELCVHGAWSTVCDDWWDSSTEARVVCKQLGCPDSSSYRVYNWAYYGQGSGDIAYVSCGGSETSLLSCYTDFDYTGCGHYEDVGVRCIRDVSVPVRPAAVTGISVRNIASTSLTISYSEARPSTTVCSTTQMCARAVCTARSSLTYEVYCDTAATGRRDYRRASTTSTSIRATGLSFNTRYRCCVIARNSVGVAGTSCHDTQTLIGPPDRPRNLRTQEPTSTSVVLHWLSPFSSSNRDHVGHYMITYGPYSNTTMLTSYSVRRLQPYTPYTFGVRAVGNIYGEDGHNACVSTTTQAAAPSQPPTSLRIPSKTSTSLTLTWTPPSSSYRNGVIRRYTVRVCDSQQGEASCIIQETSDNTTQATIAGLLPYIEYDVSVAAYTVDLGPYTTLYRQTTEQNPPTRAPEDVACSSTSPTSLRVSWSPPPLEHHNGVITGYNIIITNTSTGNTVVNTTTTTTSLSVTLNDLHPHYNYTCSVAAYTVGYGPYGNTTVQMPEDVPTASPRSLTLELSDSRTLVVSWTPPPLEHQNGVIRRYTVKVCRNQQCTEHNATGLTQRVGGLHPHYTYDVSVTAYTVGLGPFTTERRIQMPEDVPSSPPHNVTCTPSSPTSLYVSWSPPPLEHHNGVIRWYNILVINTSTGNTAVNTTTTSLSVTLNDLHPHYNYTCSVAAYTVGMGPYGNTTVQMPEDVPTASPSTVTLELSDSRTLVVSWTPPPLEHQNGVIRSYTVKVCRNQQCTEHNATGLSQRVGGLHPHYTYDVSVAAYTVGLGPFTTERRIQMPEDVSSSPPRNITCTPSSPTSLHVSWSPPPLEHHNGVIRWYNILITNTSTGNTAVNTTSSSLSVTLNDLHPHYNYTCSVAAYTVGMGPYGNTTVQMPEDAPTGAPEGVACNSTSPTSLRVSWSPPPLEHQNGVIGRYNIIITNTSTGNTAAQATSYSLLKAIYNLHPHYNYTCSVAAYTVGTGPYGNTTVQMPEDDPTASPRSLTLESSDSRTLVVSWTPPPIECQNGVIRRYTVKVCRNQQCTEHNATGLTQRVEGLHPHYTYDVSVAAYTVGLGPFTTERRIQMPEDVPSSPPRYVTCTPSSSTSLYVSWSPPPLERHNGVIRWYNILVINTSTGNTAVNTTTTSPPVTLNDLHPHYNYTCSVAAYTVGYGLYWNMTVQMPEDAPSGPPQDLTSTTLSLTSARLSWSPPEVSKQNGVIRGYHIVLHNATMRRQYNANSTTLAVPQLTSNSTYYWSVAAYTVATGPYSNETTLELELDQYSSLEIGLYSTAGVMTLLAFTIGLPVCVGVVCFYRTNPSKILRKQKRQTDKDNHTDRAPVSNKYADRSKWQRKLTTLQVLKKLHKKSVNGKQDGVVAESTCDTPAPKVPQRRYLEDVDFVAGNFDMILTGNPELPDRRYLEDIDFVTGDFDLFFKSRQSPGAANQRHLEENDDATSDPNMEEDKAQEYEQAIEMRDLSANERGVPSEEADTNRIYQPLSSATKQAETSQYASLHTIHKDDSHYVNISIAKGKPQLPPPQNNSSTGHYQPLLLSREPTQPDAEYSDPRTLYPSNPSRGGAEGRETGRKAGGERKTLRDVKRKDQHSKEKELPQRRE